MKVSKGICRNATRCSLQTSAVLLIIFMLSGCSRRDTLPLVEESVSADQHLPFDATSDKTGISPTGSLAPAAIPAGTPVTIHLRLSLSSASSRAGDPFEAVLDEPIVVRGHTLAPRGAILSLAGQLCARNEGTVWARQSSKRRDRGTRSRERVEIR